MSNGVDVREHLYHAEAEVLTGNLRLPLAQEIKSQASAKLSEKGGYLSQHETDYRLEGVIKFDRAYTQTSGNPGLKPGHGWSTLATSVLEGLNILDVVTADRVVGQMFVEHPLKGYVPEISFLGTRFENLRVAGHPVTIELDCNHFGARPDDDAPYTSSPGFLDRVNRQHEQARKLANLLEELLQRYTGVSPTNREPEAIECSLVNQARGPEGGAFPGECHGHVIHIPHFGTLCLANVHLEHTDYNESGTPKKTLIRLTMIEAHMGCVAEGFAAVGGLTTNGMTRP